MIKPPADPYRARLVEAFGNLLVAEGRTDIDYAELHRRFEAELGRSKTYTTVSRWLREFVQPREDDERAALSAVLGVTREWLFSGTAPKHHIPQHSYTPGEREADAIQAATDRAELAAKRRRERKAGGAR